MSAFKGFSEDQIQLGEDGDQVSPSIRPQAGRKKPARKITNNAVKSSTTTNAPSKPDDNISPKALLSSPTLSHTTSSPEKKVNPEDSNNPDLLKEISHDVDPGPQDHLSKMELLQQRQKALEEENKKKRQLLSKAIADRRQRTAEEAKKLQLVQVELQKMDVRVADDIKLLRKTIEDASFEYMEAQKRYAKAEREYVDAKLHLHNKEERKELLAEHLSAIIEDCEVRKAQKLSDLMKQLEIEENCDSSFIETNGAK